MLSNILCCAELCCSVLFCLYDTGYWLIPRTVVAFVDCFKFDFLTAALCNEFYFVRALDTTVSYML